MVLVANTWGVNSQGISEVRERELFDYFFKPALDKGAQIVRHHNTVQSAHDIIWRVVKNHPVVLQIQRELVDEGKNIIDTAAGESTNQEAKLDNSGSEILPKPEGGTKVDAATDVAEEGSGKLVVPTPVSAPAPSPALIVSDEILGMFLLVRSALAPDHSSRFRFPRDRGFQGFTT